jgi:3-oxoacyl-(acyl-carrier-protein) synthase
MEHGVVPRSVNAEHVDATFGLDVTHERVSRSLRTVLSNSTGFGGINAALVFRSTHDDRP